MLKTVIKALIGRHTPDRMRHLRDGGRLATVRLKNAMGGIRYVNLGAGTDADRVGWWTGDVQTGFVMDENTRLPLRDGTIDFAYSSMFFEHLYDATVANLLQETFRILKPGKRLRVVVPDFRKYIREYRSGNRDYFYSEDNPNFLTWKRYDVPLDMEHLLVNMISAIDNMPLVIVPYAFQEDLAAKPHRVQWPFHERLAGYYCGPAPELTTANIQAQLHKPDAEFLAWVFEETNRSRYQNLEFNSWHKNEWTLEKLTRFAASAGFARVEESRYGDYGDAPLDAGIEKPQHAPLGLYFDLYKA